MAKHFELTITDSQFSCERRQDAITQEAALDGLYATRTNVPAEALSAAAAVAGYKSLSHLERACRSIKTMDMLVRPIFHYSAQRVPAHVFLCMLAYCVEWHMRERLKPMLFDDEHLDEASASRASPATRAVRSQHAKAKDRTKLADDGLPLHSFRTLLHDLGTLTLNITHTHLNPELKIALTTRPTPIQAKAFALLGLNPACTQYPTPRRIENSDSARTYVRGTAKARFRRPGDAVAARTPAARAAHSCPHQRQAGQRQQGAPIR